MYYKNEFYTQDGTVGTAQTEAIAIPVSVFQSQHANNWSADSDGNAFMKAGAPRLNRTNDFIAEKDSNITGTAGRFISPSWNDDQSGIVVSLGNNGKVPVEQGATLEVKKNITAAEGFDASNYTDTDFTFDMAFENVPDGAYKAEVKQNGAVVGDPGLHRSRFGRQSRVCHQAQSGSLHLRLACGWRLHRNRAAGCGLHPGGRPNNWYRWHVCGG